MTTKEQVDQDQCLTCEHKRFNDWHRQAFPYLGENRNFCWMFPQKPFEKVVYCMHYFE